MAAKVIIRAIISFKERRRTGQILRRGKFKTLLKNSMIGKIQFKSLDIQQKSIPGPV